MSHGMLTRTSSNTLAHLSCAGFGQINSESDIQNVSNRKKNSSLLSHIAMSDRNAAFGPPLPDSPPSPSSWFTRSSPLLSACPPRSRTRGRWHCGQTCYIQGIKPIVVSWCQMMLLGMSQLLAYCHKQSYFCMSVFHRYIDTQIHVLFEKEKVLSFGTAQEAPIVLVNQATNVLSLHLPNVPCWGAYWQHCALATTTVPDDVPVALDLRQVVLAVIIVRYTYVIRR
jgi:hypothetical protein